MNRDWEKSIMCYFILLAFTIPCQGFHSSPKVCTLHGRHPYTSQKCVVVSHKSTLYTSREQLSLRSTLFDDEDIDWDAEEDADEFEIKYQSVFEENKDESNSGKGTETVKITTLNELDDTAEDYYEQLFLQQSLGLEEKTVANEEIIQEEVITSRNNEETSTESQERYEQMMVLRKEWKEKVHQMRNESIQARKIRRQSLKRKHIEERASFLALRALRLQSLPVDQSSPKKKIIRPTPSLSISSLRNYKRRGDEIGAHEYKLEQKIYGKRFGAAKEVYVRLLEVLEEMRLESTKMASELIADRVEEDVAVTILANAGGGLEAEIMKTRKTKVVDEVATMNQVQQKRMRTVVNLSLNGENVLTNNSLAEDSTSINLNTVETEDLCSILWIRGNMKRRLPKTRSKVLEQLKDSYSRPLFELPPGGL